MSRHHPADRWVRRQWDEFGGVAALLSLLLVPPLVGTWVGVGRKRAARLHVAGEVRVADPPPPAGLHTP